MTTLKAGSRPPATRSKSDGLSENANGNGQESCKGSSIPTFDDPLKDSGEYEWETVRTFGDEELEEIDPYTSSDDSDLESSRPLKNTIGNIPIEWYEDMPHIGYDVDGKRIMRPAVGDELDKFLSKMDDPDFKRSLPCSKDGVPIKLTDEELEVMHKVQAAEFAMKNYDPYPDTIEHFTSIPQKLPLVPDEPLKSTFIPSRDYDSKVFKLAMAIRRGLIIPHATRKKPALRLSLLWGPDGKVIRTDDYRAWASRPAPKESRPSHHLSYNAPEEYLPEDGSKTNYTALRSVPAYGPYLRERFERLLDLYLAPRVQKPKPKKPPIKNLSELMPKLPSPRDLMPFPSQLALEFFGHSMAVTGISADPTGQWLASCSHDGDVRIWEVQTGRCCQVIPFKERLLGIAWNPVRGRAIILVTMENGVRLVDASWFVSSEDDAKTVSNLLRLTMNDDGRQEAAAAGVSWSQVTNARKRSELFIAHHNTTLTQTQWHRKGDYFLCGGRSGGDSRIVIHQLSKHRSQCPFRSLKVSVQCAIFHPSKPKLFVSSENSVFMYDLQRLKLQLKMAPHANMISCIDAHPSGDHIIIGSEDRWVVWFDLDYSSRAYKRLRYHSEAIIAVKYHRRFPLFATAAADGRVHVFHAQVFRDLLKNPLIVPVKILKAHEQISQQGVLALDWHPTSPWCFTAGNDGMIKMWVP